MCASSQLTDHLLLFSINNKEVHNYSFKTIVGQMPKAFLSNLFLFCGSLYTQTPKTTEDNPTGLLRKHDRKWLQFIKLV